jgi:hypothetical protein
LLNSHNENPVVLSATGFLFGTKEITMTKKHNPTDKDIECFNEFCDQLEKEHGFKKVAPPKDAGTIVIFPGLDGKVDMIDAVEALYGIKQNPGDRVMPFSIYGIRSLFCGNFTENPL